MGSQSYRLPFAYKGEKTLTNRGEVSIIYEVVLIKAMKGKRRSSVTLRESAVGASRWERFAILAPELSI